MSEQMEMLLNTKKLNYDRLSGIVPSLIPRTGTDYDTVNIIIDVYDVVKKLYSPSVLEELSGTNKAKDMRMITSEIVNMVGHYRHYFASRLYKYTTFYFIYSDKRSKYHLDSYPEYKKDFYNKRLSNKVVECKKMNSLLLKNIEMIRLIVNRIPNCSFINSKEIEYSLIPYILYKEEILYDGNPTIIISNDNIFFQDLLLDDNIMILLTAGKNSRIVTIDTVYDELILNLKNVPDFDFSQNLITVLMAMSGHKNYNIPGVNRMSYGRSIKLLNKMIKDGEIKDMEYTSFSMFQKVVDKSSMKDEMKKDLMRNFKLISHSAQEDIVYTKTDVRSISNQCDIYTPSTAKEIKLMNQRFFHDNPINFEFCFEGEIL